MHFNLKINIQFKYYTRYVSIVGTILIRQHTIFFLLFDNIVNYYFTVTTEFIYI